MKSRLAMLAATLLLMLLSAASAQDSSRWQAPNARPPRRYNSQPDAAPSFQVSVRLVNVFASVVDSDGAPYVKLDKNDFRVFEDGVEQELAVFERQSALPISIVMGLDTSLSTRKDLSQEVASARRFARAIIRPVDAISLYEFSTYVYQALPFTNDERRLESALSHPRTGPATALYDVIYLGARSLERRQGRKVIVLISDGGDTASKIDYTQALRAAQNAEAIIYPIIMVPIEADAGRDTGGEHALIQLSNDTGGKYFYASSVAQVDDAFRQIGEELRTQYLLAYYPAKPGGPGFHRIEVQLTAGAQQSAQRELIVHHRTGYYGSK